MCFTEENYLFDGIYYFHLKTLAHMTCSEVKCCVIHLASIEWMHNIGGCSLLGG